MKRYLVFAFLKGRPDGGWDDLDGDFSRSSEGIDRVFALVDIGCEAYLVDTKTMTKVEFA